MREWLSYKSNRSYDKLWRGISIRLAQLRLFASPLCWQCSAWSQVAMGGIVT